MLRLSNWIFESFFLKFCLSKQLAILRMFRCKVVLARDIKQITPACMTSIESKACNDSMALYFCVLCLIYGLYSVSIQYTNLVPWK